MFLGISTPRSCIIKTSRQSGRARPLAVGSPVSLCEHVEVGGEEKEQCLHSTVLGCAGCSWSPWTVRGSLWERHSAVTTPSQAQVARPFLSHTETVKEPQPKVYRSMKMGCQTPKTPGARAGQLATYPLPFPVRGQAPQFKSVLASRGCGLSLPCDFSFLRESWSLDFHVKFPYSNNGNDSYV